LEADPKGGDRPTAARLWRELTREEREAIARGFFEQEDLAPEAAQALAREIGPRRGFREAGFLRLPLEMRSRMLATTLDLREDVAATLLLVFHMEERRPLLRRFLDLLSIPHEDGMLGEEEHPLVPTVEAVEKATDALLAEFPAASVRLYYRALLTQEPSRWAALEPALRRPALAACAPPAPA
jgi:hypothetical protein